MSTPAFRNRSAWRSLQAHHQEIKSIHLRHLFADVPKRGELLTAEAEGVYRDYS